MAVKCPYPDCNYVCDVLTNFHCTTMHHITKNEVISKYGEPVSLVAMKQRKVMNERQSNSKTKKKVGINTPVQKETEQRKSMDERQSTTKTNKVVDSNTSVQKETKQGRVYGEKKPRDKSMVFSLVCKGCGGKFNGKSSRTKYCEKCKEINKANKEKANKPKVKKKSATERFLESMTEEDRELLSKLEQRTGIKFEGSNKRDLRAYVNNIVEENKTRDVVLCGGGFAHE